MWKYQWLELMTSYETKTTEQDIGQLSWSSLMEAAAHGISWNERLKHNTDEM